MDSKRVGYSHVLQEMCRPLIIWGMWSGFSLSEFFFFYLLRDLQLLRIAPPR